MAFGKDVHVDEELLRTVRSTMGSNEGRVLTAFLGPGGVPPFASTRRCREVGLLGAAFDFVEDLLLERSEMVHAGGRVLVLGFQVRQRVGIIAVAQPGVFIDKCLAVDVANHWNLLGLGYVHGGSLGVNRCHLGAGHAQMSASPSRVPMGEGS